MHCKAVSDVQQFGYAYDTVQKYEEEHRGAMPDGQQDQCGTHPVFVLQLSSQDKEQHVGQFLPGQGECQ